jgi:hypothetical protein
MSFLFLRTTVVAVVLLSAVSSSADILQPNRMPENASADTPSPDETPDSDWSRPADGPDTAGADLPWSYHWLPDGLVYRSYLAGVKEPRFSLVQSHVEGLGRTWDATLGARVAILRYGTPNAYRPEGWELDLEGGALPRLQPKEPSSPLDSCDYRVGLPITYGIGPWQYKTGYTHTSAHLGDEFMLRNPDVERINYVRDSWMFGIGYFCTDDLRLFGEYDYAFVVGGGAEPCEFQFGADYSPAVPGGAPFAAAYIDSRQELDFGGYFVVQGGWQIRGGQALHTLRLGAEYVNGKSTQNEFYNNFEQRYGLGVWYDF